MPFIYNKFNPDEQNKGQQQGQVFGPKTGVVGSSQGSAITSGGETTPRSSPQAAPNAPKSSSGQFTNLNKYLEANKGAGQQIGKAIAGSFEQQTQQLGKEVDQNKSAIQNQLDAEKTRLAQASGFQQQITQDPTKITQDQNQLSQFQQIAGGTSALPGLQTQAQQKLDAAQVRFGNLKDTSNLAGSEAGRFQLLKQTLGRPSYSRGQQDLDQLLLQSENKGGLLNRLQTGMSQNLLGAEQSIGGAKTSIDTGLKQLGTDVSTAQTLLKTALGGLSPSAGVVGTGALGDLQKSLQQRQADFIKEQSEKLGTLQSKIGTAQDSGTIDDELMKQLGLESGSKLYNLNLKELLQPSFTPEMVTEQSVATPEELARYQALATLSGTSSQGYLNPNNIGGTQAMRFDPSEFKRQLQTAKDQEAAEIKAIENAALGKQGETFTQTMGGLNTQLSQSKEELAALQAKAAAQPFDPEAGMQVPLAPHEQERLQYLQNYTTSMDQLGIFDPKKSTEEILRTVRRGMVANPGFLENVKRQYGGEAYGLNEALANLASRSDRLYKISPDRFVNQNIVKKF